MKNAKRVRIDKGETLLQVSLATKLDASRISKFERDIYHELGYQDMKVLAEHYGVTIDDLLADVPAPAEAQR